MSSPTQNALAGRSSGRLFLAAALYLVPLIAFADVQTGLDAYQAGDYTTAFKVLRPLAVEGDADAQYHLGMMYRKGQGVPKDADEAAKWFSKAKGQGMAIGGWSSCK